MHLDVPPHLQHWQFLICPSVQDLPSFHSNYVALLEIAVYALQHTTQTFATFPFPGGVTLRASWLLGPIIIIERA